MTDYKCILEIILVSLLEKAKVELILSQILTIDNPGRSIGSLKEVLPQKLILWSFSCIKLCFNR